MVRVVNQDKEKEAKWKSIRIYFYPVLSQQETNKNRH